MDNNHSLSIRARKKVKAQIERAERERKITLFQRRMELAREGAIAYKDGKLKSSAQAYFQYLAILEKDKGVKQGMLEPKHFDPKRDIAELLLLSGVFWDLAKLHDRLNRKTSTKLEHFLDRFVLFSKGMSFQHVSAELVRKYLMHHSPHFRSSFKDAHIRLGGGKCFIATAVEEHCAEKTLPALRYFRDARLLRNPGGRVFVRVYYRVGPVVSRILIRMPESFQKRVARVLDGVAARVLRKI